MPEEWPIDPDECWRWAGAYNADGRPRLSDRYAYAVIYEAVSGYPVPEGHVLHHLCGRPWCVNPWHLEPLTRAAHLEEHRPLMPVACRNGHLLGGDNLYLAKGKRYCKACQKANRSRKGER